MIITESQGRLWGRVWGLAVEAAVLLFVCLVMAGTGCSRPPDYINQPSIINVPESAMYPASTGEAKGGDSSAPKAQNYSRHNGQAGDLRIQKKGGGSEYVIYDPDNPQADKYGIVYLQGDRSASKSEYTTYDPDHPDADERGMVHLTVRKAQDSKLGSSLEQQSWKNRSASPMSTSDQSRFQKDIAAEQQHYVESLKETQRSNYEPPRKITEVTDYAKRGDKGGEGPQISGVQVRGNDQVKAGGAKREYPVGTMSVEEYSKLVSARMGQVKNDSPRTVPPTTMPQPQQARLSQENMMSTIPVNSSNANKQGPTISNVSITEIAQPAAEPEDVQTPTMVVPNVEVPKTNNNGLSVPGVKIEKSGQQNIPVPQSKNNQSINATSPGVNAVNPVSVRNMSVNANRMVSAGGVNPGGAYPGVKMSVQQNINPTQYAQPTVASRPSQPQRQNVSIDQTITELERYVTEHPDQVKAQMALQLLHSVYGNKEAMRVLPANMTSEQKSEMEELTQAILLAAQLSQNNMSQQPEAANQALKALQQISGKLAGKADPVVTCMKICSKVEGFGQYKEIPSELLETGEPREVLVYCELENYQAERDAEGRFLTKLHASITLFNSSYRVVGQPLIADVNDKPTYHLRRDFFLRGPLTLPRLSAGQYEIVVTIEDKIAHKIARAKRYRFEVKGAQ